MHRSRSLVVGGTWITAALVALISPGLAVADPTTAPASPTSTDSSATASPPASTTSASPTTTRASSTTSSAAPSAASSSTSPATSAPQARVAATVTLVSTTLSGLVGQTLPAQGVTTVVDPTAAATEVLLDGQWSRSQITHTIASGTFTLPLTYGATTAGTYSYRLRVDSGAGSVYTDPFTVTRLSTAPTVMNAPNSVTTDITGSVWTRVANTGADRAVATQFLIAGQWSTSQVATTNSTGDVTLPLTYGATTPGTYTWRVVSTNAYGVMLASRAYVLTRTAPSPTSVPAVWTACTTTLQGVTVSIGRTEHSRIIVDQTTTSRATVGLYARDRRKACAFTTVYTETGWIGAAGTKAASARTAGDDSTPLGTYTLTESFGYPDNPGTNLPYIKTTNYDYWVWDSSSAYFNTLRDYREGGFSTAKSERIRSYDAIYKYAIVIDFNRNPVIARSRGGGIRFHLSNGRATGGCVAVGETNLLKTMRTVISGDRITIVG